jgi:hypothetical protein
LDGDRDEAQLVGRDSHVPATKAREVSHMLKAIYALESRDAAEKKAKEIIGELRAGKMTRLLISSSSDNFLINFAILTSQLLVARS